MRRWVLIAALGVVLLAIPVWAQRGGHGGMSGGGRGGGFGYHGGGGYTRGPMYGGAPHGGGYWGGGGYSGWHGYPGHFPYYPGRYPYYPGRYGWRWGYPWRYGYGGYGYPWWGWYGGIGWYDTYDSYPAQSYPSYVSTPPADSSAYIAVNQQQEIDRLNDEIARLRYEQQSQKPAPQPPKVVEISSATVLVFRDHHTEEAQNYAIVGKTLWVFTEQRARKIPIGELDIPATTKANDVRGIDFRP